MNRPALPFLFCLFFCLFLVPLVFSAGCGDKFPPCKARTDCPDPALYSCINNKLCYLNCKSDTDCKSIGETCKQGYCGERPGVVPPTGDCKEGETRECYSASAGCSKAGAIYSCTGTCKAGKQTCGADLKWASCQDEIGPAAEEVCGDNKDNNCDGRTDEDCGTLTCKLQETRECYTGAPGTKDKGRCKAGKQTCVPGEGNKPEWGDCEDQILPVPEQCTNEIDDNCDGQVNEGCDCKLGESRKCQAPNGCAGIQSCQRKQGGDGSQWSTCTASQPSDEACDGLDNDCDGKIDNVKGGADLLTRECINTCFKGIETCKQGQWKDCTAELVQTEEIYKDNDPDPKKNRDDCNNKDDDCDGKIDNIRDKDSPLQRSCNPPGALGPCKDLATQSCKNGVWGECIPGKPGEEACNDVDDDCDGKVDENNPCPDGMECIKDTLGQKKCVNK